MLQPLISVVIPVFHNAGTVEALFERIKLTLEGAAQETDYEVIFVDDGSNDESWKVLCSLKEQHSQRISLIKLARNFGQISALLAGFRLASGKCCIAISADLQDPPEVIEQMLVAWRDGHQLVVAARASRDDGFLTNAVSNAGWWMLRRFAVPNIPRGGFDFFLMDRSVLDQFVTGPEQHVFIQGRLLFFVSKPFVIRYDRGKVLTGRGQTGLTRRLKYFVDGFTSYSYLPMRIMSAVGLLMAMAAFIATGVVIVLAFAAERRVEGWASLAVMLLFVSGMQLLCIGIIGEYLWRAVEEIRRRPHYVIEATVSRSA